ncbi:MAG TPA: IPT/TIG domain-containing protein [Polyangiaceae bacterium]
MFQLRRAPLSPKRTWWSPCLLLLFALACSDESSFEPRIESLQPSQIPFGVATTCTIHGKNFRAQLRIDVDSRNAPVVNRSFAVWVGAEAMPTGSISSMNTTTLAFVAPPSLAVGLYDLKLQTPTGLWATLPNALTVFAPNTSSGGVGNDALATTVTGGNAPIRSGSGGVGTSFGGAASGGLSPSGGTSSSAGSTAVSSGGTEPLNSTTNSAAGGTLVGNTSGAEATAGGSAGRSASSTAGDTNAGTTSSGGAGGSSSGAAAGRLGSAGVTAKAGDTGAGLAGVAGMANTRHLTMWTDGQVLRDTCEQAIVLRGVQQSLGKQLPQGNDWARLMDEIAASGANAVRIQVETAALNLPDVTAVVARIFSHNMVAIVSPDNRAWYSNPSVATSLAKYRSRLIFDAYYPSFDDRTRFVKEAKAAVAQIRAYGYVAPLLVSTNAYGRDLPAALNYGAEIIAADPVHNVVIAWDAYWGNSGTYQTRYGMSLTAGIAAAAGAAFPILMGLTLITDSSPVTQYLDYDAALTAAQANGTGWLWWDFFNPYGNQNDLSADGTANRWTTLGARVVNTHPGGLSHTANWSCGAQ